MKLNTMQSKNKKESIKRTCTNDDFVTSGIGEKGEELHKIDEASF